MEVLNLSHGGISGSRFNGWDIRDELKRHGINLTFGHFDAQEDSPDWAVQLFPEKQALASAISRLERLSGRLNYFQFWGKSILEHPSFLKADVVHLHIVHTQWLGIQTIREICSAKPTVWTWHDLWPVTGHCIQPGTCERWQKGCGSCPQLNIPIAVKVDRTAKEYRKKLAFLGDLDFHLHVSTNWMESQVRDHVSLRNEITQFPFGLERGQIVLSSREEARKILGIPEDSVVFIARATRDPIKRFSVAVDTVAKLAKSFPSVYLLTVGETGNDVPDPIRVIEFPWLKDPQDLSLIYAASDFFLSPSTGESFGMMVLESMAHGVVPVVIRGSATSEVAGSAGLPVGGGNDLAVKMVEVAAPLIRNRSLLREAQEKASTRFADFKQERFVRNLSHLYAKALGQG